MAIAQTNDLKSGLMDLGLSTDEIEVYSLLLRAGAATARQISQSTRIIVNSVYRATNNLEVEGLVKKLDTRPRQFQVTPPRLAIKQMTDKQIADITEARQSIISQLDYKTTPNRLNMDVLTGREELFECFVVLAKQAKKEILVISIGEPVPESIWAVTKESIAKGVKTRFIFHKRDKENIMLYKRWLAMGVDVRYLPGEGYHLNIFDHSSAILSASNPRQSKERSGVVIYNEAIIQALRNYFDQQWQKTKELRKT